MRAKPAVPLAGPTLVERVVRRLAENGVRDLVLNLHYLPATITGIVGDGRQLGAHVRYSWENPVLGSAGGPRRALPLLPDEGFFIVNGDTLADVDFDALAAQHRESGALVTMAVYDGRDLVRRYGGVVTDSKGIVYGFVPSGPAAVGYHFVGVQMAHPSAFAGLDPDTPAETTRGLYRTLIAERPGSIRAFLAKGTFHDVGTPADYLAASLSIARAEGLTAPPIGERSVVDPTAAVTESAIWNDVTVGAHARLARCVVADGVNIPAGARFEGRAIVQGARDLIVTDITDG